MYIGDLDLSKYTDVKELELRIELVAKDSCERLNEMFPLSNRRSKDARRCIELAIKRALAEKEAAIEAANQVQPEQRAQILPTMQNRLVTYHWQIHCKKLSSPGPLRKAVGGRTYS